MNSYDFQGVSVSEIKLLVALKYDFIGNEPPNLLLERVVIEDILHAAVIHVVYHSFEDGEQNMFGQILVDYVAEYCFGNPETFLYIPKTIRTLRDGLGTPSGFLCFLMKQVNGGFVSIVTVSYNGRVSIESEVFQMWGDQVNVKTCIGSFLGDCLSYHEFRPYVCTLIGYDSRRHCDILQISHKVDFELWDMYEDGIDYTEPYMIKSFSVKADRSLEVVKTRCKTVEVSPYKIFL